MGLHLLPQQEALFQDPNLKLGQFFANFTGKDLEEISKDIPKDLGGPESLPGLVLLDWNRDVAQFFESKLKPGSKLAKNFAGLKNIVRDLKGHFNSDGQAEIATKPEILARMGGSEQRASGVISALWMWGQLMSSVSDPSFQIAVSLQSINQAVQLLEQNPENQSAANEVNHSRNDIKTRVDELLDTIRKANQAEQSEQNERAKQFNAQNKQQAIQVLKGIYESPENEELLGKQLYQYLGDALSQLGIATSPGNGKSKSLGEAFGGLLMAGGDFYNAGKNAAAENPGTAIAVGAVTVAVVGLGVIRPAIAKGQERRAQRIGGRGMGYALENNRQLLRGVTEALTGLKERLKQTAEATKEAAENGDAAASEAQIVEQAAKDIVVEAKAEWAREILIEVESIEHGMNQLNDMATKLMETPDVEMNQAIAEGNTAQARKVVGDVIGNVERQIIDIEAHLKKRKIDQKGATEAERAQIEAEMAELKKDIQYLRGNPGLLKRALGSVGSFFWRMNGGNFVAGLGEAKPVRAVRRTFRGAVDGLRNTGETVTETQPTQQHTPPPGSIPHEMRPTR